MSHAYCCLLPSRRLGSSHYTLYLPFERECVEWQDQIPVVKETMLTAVPPTEEEKIKIIRPQLVTSNI